MKSGDNELCFKIKSRKNTKQQSKLGLLQKLEVELGVMEHPKLTDHTPCSFFFN